jgi:outer membrane lipoprotein carrier protein
MWRFSFFGIIMNVGLGLLTRFLLCVCFFCSSVSLAQQPASVGDALQQMETFNQQTQSLSGRFIQKGQKTSTGEFIFSRPGKFWWYVKTPYEQWLVSDGVQFTWYDADIEQAVIRPLKNALEDSPVALLFGSVRLKDVFDLRVSERMESGAKKMWVEGSPKSGSAFYKKVRLLFEQNLPQVMELEDNFGKLTRIEFSQLKTNVAVPVGQFQFKIPPQATIIRDNQKGTALKTK